jgi:hypothetical protein
LRYYEEGPELRAEGMASAWALGRTGKSTASSDDLWSACMETDNGRGWGIELLAEAMAVIVLNLFPG